LNSKLFVGGLSWNTTEDDLFQYFNQFGAISNVNIKYNTEGKSRGFGFVTFTSNGSIEAVSYFCLLHRLYPSPVFDFNHFS
jgi:RNA recognition motif-containing protein